METVSTTWANFPGRCLCAKTHTPSSAVRNLPFYILEAGHFLVSQHYAVNRKFHDSFLLIYTLQGAGRIRCQSLNTRLLPDSCTVIDCHFPHTYLTAGDNWEFYWIHFSGPGAYPLYALLTARTSQCITAKDPAVMRRTVAGLVDKCEQNDLLSCAEISGTLHTLLNTLIRSGISVKDSLREINYAKEVHTAVAFIQKNYSRQISVDDMIYGLPISKYHFIRCFRRIMGDTPYSYLTSCRLNTAKKLLRTTDLPIQQIASDCGFRTASNFIVQFKNHIGLLPTYYRQSFFCFGENIVGKEELHYE